MKGRWRICEQEHPRIDFQKIFTIDNDHAHTPGKIRLKGLGKVLNGAILVGFAEVATFFFLRDNGPLSASGEAYAQAILFVTIPTGLTGILMIMAGGLPAIAGRKWSALHWVMRILYVIVVSLVLFTAAVIVTGVTFRLMSGMTPFPESTP